MSSICKNSFDAKRIISIRPITNNWTGEIRPSSAPIEMSTLAVAMSAPIIFPSDNLIMNEKWDFFSTRQVWIKIHCKVSNNLSKFNQKSDTFENGTIKFFRNVMKNETLRFLWFETHWKMIQKFQIISNFTWKFLNPIDFLHTIYLHTYMWVCYISISNSLDSAMVHFKKSPH